MVCTLYKDFVHLTLDTFCLQRSGYCYHFTSLFYAIFVVFSSHSLFLFAMVTSRNIAFLILGFGSFLASAHPTDSAKALGTTAENLRRPMRIRARGVNSEVPASCIATSYNTYKAIVAKCPTSVLLDIKVPVGGQIALTNLKSQTVRLTPFPTSLSNSDKCAGCFRRHNRVRALPKRSRTNLPLDHIQLIHRLPNRRARR